jgi:hypothetical protein
MNDTLPPRETRMVGGDLLYRFSALRSTGGGNCLGKFGFHWQRIICGHLCCVLGVWRACLEVPVRRVPGDVGGFREGSRFKHCVWVRLGISV